MAPCPSPFTPEQETWIVLKYGELQSLISVRRLFRKEFKVTPQHIPTLMAFSRVVTRFKETGCVKAQNPPGPNKTKITDENITTIKALMENYPTV